MKVVPKKGGGYLDFGVIKKNIVEAIYEVKSQDYIRDRGFGINKALREVWNNKHHIKSFITQDGEIYNSASQIEGHLILLVGPNNEGVKNLGRKNIKYVHLFSEIFEDLSGYSFHHELHKIFLEDLPKVIKKLKNPDQGRLINSKFINLRNNFK